MNKIADIYKDYTPEERLDMVAEILKEGMIKLWAEENGNGSKLEHGKGRPEDDDCPHESQFSQVRSIPPSAPNPNPRYLS